MVDRLISGAVVRQDQGEVNRFAVDIKMKIPIFVGMVADFV